MSDQVLYCSIYNPIDSKMLLSVGTHCDMKITYESIALEHFRSKSTLRVHARQTIQEELYKIMLYRTSSAIIVLVVLALEYPDRVTIKMIDEILNGLRLKAPGYELYERKSLERSVKGFIREKLNKYNELESVDALSKAIGKSEECIRLAETNIEMLMDRGENLNELNDKAQGLLDNAHEFDRDARKLRNVMKWYKNKQILATAGGVSALGTLMWFMW
jgi:hypothetical protein